MSGNPCLIVEWSEASDWPALHGFGQGAPRRIPAGSGPTVMQANRAIAEAEAKRLATLHPEKRFAVFEAVAVATGTEIPTHVTVSGQIWASRKVGVLMEIDDDQIPF